VIELSHDGPPDLEFRGDAQRNITVALMHSACDLKGYEVVIKQLVDPESNEWTDLETDNFWHTSGIKQRHVTIVWFIDGFSLKAQISEGH